MLGEYLGSVIYSSSSSKGYTRSSTNKSIGFFQAEEAIRDYKVTGVQTCALPISSCQAIVFPWSGLEQRWRKSVRLDGVADRSGESRVGKECRFRWSPYHYKKPAAHGCGGRGGWSQAGRRAVVSAEPDSG